MTCPLSALDGAYVLGSLSPSERQDFERHLSTCDECSRNVRELAGLPGLLARVDRSVLDFETPGDPVPDTLLPSLVAQVRRRRRLGLLATVGAAAAAALVAAGVALAVSAGGDGQGSEAVPPGTSETATSTPASTPTPSPTPTRRPTPTATPTTSTIQMTTVGGAPVRGWLTFESVAWGTRIDLDCTYAATADGGPGQGGYASSGSSRYAMYVRTNDGWVDEVGSWRGVQGSMMHVTAPTSADRDEIASVVVRTLEGRPVLRHTS